nr:permease of the major facilitator superfamily [uncultured archaeon]CBH36600.1 conserved hypothetical membrane protein, major facilitator superfamily [uncultured archaeon]
MRSERKVIVYILSLMNSKRNNIRTLHQGKNIIVNKTQQRIFISVLLLANFMGPLDGTIVIIALPSIAHDFNASTSMVAWVLIAFALIAASFKVMFGKLGDLKGLKTVFITGLVICTLGSFLCSISWSLVTLIIFRIIQAIGAAMFTAITPGMVPTYLPGEIRGKVLGYASAARGLGLALGAPIGGFIAGYLSWHWIFLINVPIGIVAIYMGTKVVPFSKGEPKKFPFDVAGAALIFFALLSLVFAINTGPQLGWTSVLIIGCLFASLVFWIGFYVQEKRSPDPLMDLNLLHNRVFTLGTGAYFMMYLAFSGALFALPFYLKLVKGVATHISGIYLMVPAVMIVIFGTFAGSLSDRVGSRGICSVSALGGCVAFFLLSMLGVESSTSFILIAMALMGIAVGTFAGPMSSLIMGHSPAGKLGMASAIMTTGIMMGSTLGVALFEAIFTQTGGMPGRVAHTLAAGMLVPGFHSAFLVGVVCCIIALVLSLVARDRPSDTSV